VQDGNIAFDLLSVHRVMAERVPLAGLFDKECMNDPVSKTAAQGRRLASAIKTCYYEKHWR
jgi:hypothetical protein